MIQRTPLCILNHFHHYFYDWNYDCITRKNSHEQWNQIIDLLDKIPFSWKTTFIDLYQGIKKIRKMNIAITGQKITIISSDQLLEDISFKVDKKLHLEKENAVMMSEIKQLLPLIN